jgi:hypothetical protein
MYKPTSFLFSAIICLLLSSCWHMNEPKEDKPKAQPITVQNFSKYPDDIDGCSCYFSSNEKAFNQKQYIIATNLDSLAFMTINNQKTKLKLTSSGAEPNTFTNFNHVEVFGNKDYKVTIDIKYKKSTDSEVWIDEGTITITRKDGQKLLTKFYGECGC